MCYKDDDPAEVRGREIEELIRRTTISSKWNLNIMGAAFKK